MLQTIEISNPAGELLTLPMEDVVVGYPVREVEGLEPVRAVLVSSSFANEDGGQYQSARREERNIKLQLGLEPDWSIDETVREMRVRLYSFFMPKSEVKFKFTLEDGLEVEIKARVEDCTPAIFAREPAIDISTICFDPDFIDPTPVVVEGDTVDDMTEISIPYVGTVATGVEFTMNVDRDLSEFTIYHRPPDGTTRTTTFAYDLIAGDVLKISTVRGNKYLTLTRASTTTSVLNGLSPQSNWTEFDKGTNYIRVYAEGDPVPYTISYITRYGAL